MKPVVVILVLCVCVRICYAENIPSSANRTQRTTPLSVSGNDRAHKKSPDGRYAVFIRKSQNQAYLTVGDETEYPGDAILADQIWLFDTSAGKERLLVADKIPGKGDITQGLQQGIAFIDDDSLCFSPDGANLYFISSAWVVSGALHAVNLRTGRERFVAAANTVEVVPSGEYAGHLIVQQHRYFMGNGSYDWYWLIDPQGREIGPVGETLEQVAVFKSTYR